MSRVAKRKLVDKKVNFNSNARFDRPGHSWMMARSGEMEAIQAVDAVRTGLYRTTVHSTLVLNVRAAVLLW